MSGINLTNNNAQCLLSNDNSNDNSTTNINTNIKSPSVDLSAYKTVSSSLFKKSTKLLKNFKNSCLLPHPNLVKRLYGLHKQNISKLTVENLIVFNQIVSLSNMKHKKNEDMSVMSINYFKTIPYKVLPNGIATPNIFKDYIFSINKKGYIDFNKLNDSNDNTSFAAEIQIELNHDEISNTYGNYTKTVNMILNILKSSPEEFSDLEGVYKDYFESHIYKKTSKNIIANIINSNIDKKPKHEDLLKLTIPGLENEQNRIISELETFLIANKSQYEDIKSRLKEIDVEFYELNLVKKYNKFKKDLRDIKNMKANTIDNVYYYFRNKKDNDREYTALTFMSSRLRDDLFGSLGFKEIDLPSAAPKILLEMFDFEMLGIKFIADKRHNEIISELSTSTSKKTTFNMGKFNIRKSESEIRSDLKQVFVAATLGSVKLKSQHSYLKHSEMFKAVLSRVKKDVSKMQEWISDDLNYTNLCAKLNIDEDKFFRDDTKSLLANLFMQVESKVIEKMETEFRLKFDTSEIFRLHDALYIRTSDTEKDLRYFRVKNKFELYLNEILQ